MFENDGSRIFNSNILVIDDEELNLDIVSEILLGAGYKRFDVVSSPTKAVQKFKENEYDIVLLDMLMPEMNGAQVIKEFEKVKIKHNIPILILTAVDNKNVIYYMLSEGSVRDYLTKPFDENELLARIRNLLEIRMLNKTLELEVKRQTKKLLQIQLEIVSLLGRAVEYKDYEEGKHTLRVGLMAKEVALALGMSQSKAELIKHAAFIHDIGKVGVPDSILLKNGFLDDNERVMMQKHTIIGEELLRKSNLESKFLDMAADIALYHHERHNGSGYPKGLVGEQIPKYAKIVGIVDVFDALLSERPFKEPWSYTKAINYIKENKTKEFCSEIVEAFLKAEDKIFEIQREHNPRLSI